MRRTAILIPIAAALALGFGFFLANQSYGIPGPRLPFLAPGTQKIGRTLTLGHDRPEVTLAWSAGEFELRSQVHLAEGEVLDLYFRVARIRKGIMDFNRIRLEAGAELKQLEPDAVGERIQVPASIDLPLVLRGTGTSYSFELGEERVTGVLAIGGRSRFAHGWFQLAGRGRVENLEIDNLGGPRNGMQEMFWFFVPILAALLTFLFVARTWGFRLMVFLLLLLFCVFVTEIGYRKSPIQARAYDLQRTQYEAETLDAFGFLHPERNMDVLLGRFSDLFSILLPPRGEVYRVALVGFEAAGQEDRPPSMRWYAPVGTILTERFGRQVEVLHAFHSGARPSACLKQLRPLFAKLGVDLIVWAVAPKDFEKFESPAWEPAKEGWSPILILNALGMAQGPRSLVFEGDAEAFAAERNASKIKTLDSLSDPGRAPWEVTGPEARQRVETLCEEIQKALR